LQNIFENIFDSSKINLLLNICKIFIISISAIYLLGNFSPFYEGQDSYLYGIESVFLSKGIYEIPNPLLEETGRFEFTAGNWNPTIHDTLIPIAGIGTPLLGAIAYSIGGYYGLFYLAPILGITLLIIYERITTKLFGKYIGFLALLFFASCHIFFRSAIHLNTDAILTLFFVLGIFCLIKFLRNGNPNYILLTSVFFGISCLVKIPALVFFPLEMITLLSYFSIRFMGNYFPILKNNFSDKLFFPINRKKLVKISIFAIIPWVIFFGFWFSYNDHFYGSPTSTYFSVITKGEHTTSSRIDTLLILEQRDIDQAKDYAKYLLPYQIPAIYNKINNNLDETLGKNWPGLLFLPLLLFSLYVSFKQKLHRLEFSVFSLFIFGIIGFYAGQTPEWRAELGLPSRYMLPAITLSLILWSFLIVRIFISIENFKIIKFLRILIILFLMIFFIFAFSLSPSIQFLISDNNFTNPVNAASKYDLEKENLPENSVILAKNTDTVIEYEITPFRLDNIQSWDLEKSDLLKDILHDGYSVYVFKKSTALDEKEVLTYLVDNRNIILKEYSNTFCKIYINNDTMSSDDICLFDDLKS
jgi:hypothetical protein